MNIGIVLLAFILGIVCGIASIYLAIPLLLNKTYLSKQTTHNTSTSVFNTNKLSISDRMARVREITDEQLTLSSEADGPQKNGLDGKYKNSIIAKIKTLDEEKNELLKSILEDGYDPELTTINASGVVNQMKLSEYMAYLGISMPAKNNVTTSSTPPKTERLGKFTVIKGGKDDDGSNTTH